MNLVGGAPVANDIEALMIRTGRTYLKWPDMEHVV